MNEISPREFRKRIVAAASCTIIVALVLIVQSSALGVEVQPGHPRILINLDENDLMYREAMRARFASGGPLNADFVALQNSLSGYLDDDVASVSDGDLIDFVGLAFVHQMLSGDSVYGRKGAEFLVELISRGILLTLNTRELVGLGYDWLHDIMTVSERLVVADVLEASGQSVIGVYGNPYHEAVRAVRPVLVPALALYGDGVKDEFAEQALVDAAAKLPWVLAGLDEVGGDNGGWYTTDPYGRIYFTEFLPMLVYWATATDENYLKLLDSNWTEEHFPGRGDRRELGSDFWRHILHWYMFNTRPSPSGEPFRTHKPGDALHQTHVGASACRFLARTYSNPHFEWFAEQLHLYGETYEEPWLKLLYQGNPDAMNALEPDGLVRFFSTHCRQGDVSCCCQEPWERAGTVYMRSGWDLSPTSMDVTASFKDNLDFFPVTSHDHAHRNSFVITRGLDNLAVDSGVYDSGLSEHRSGYYRLTGAHNAIVADGESQIFNSSMLMEPGSITEPDKILSFVSKFEAVPTDIGSEYVYVQGDASRAYNPSKVESYLRDFVWVGHEYFVVLDRVKAKTGVEFDSVKWLLHTIHWDDDNPDNHIVPEFCQNKTGSAGTFPADPSNIPPNIDALHGGTPGHFSEDTNIVRTENGDSALFCWTLLPESHRTTMVGGPDANGEYNKSTVRGDPTDSYEYWWNGRNWPAGWLDLGSGYEFVPSRAETPLPPSEGGNWRIEVEPIEPQSEQLFLHVLHPAANTVSVSETPEMVLIETDDLVGVHIKAAGGNVAATFSSAADGSPHSSAVSYQVTPTADTKHVAHDLIPDTSYDVSVVKDGPVHSISIASGTMIRTSVLGILTFTVLQDGNVNQAPSLELGASPDSGQSPLPTSLSATATDPDGEVVSYLWKFGDGEVSTEQAPSHTFTRAGMYTVRCAVTDDKNDVTEASVVVSAIDASAPTVPTDLHTETVTDTNVLLAWGPSEDDEGVAQYEVYRDMSYVGSSASTGFNDSNLLGDTTYEYRVLAVDTGSNKSALSAPLSVTTLEDTTPPTVAVNLSATPGNRYVALSWSANPEPDIAGYNVYRAETSGGPYAMVHQTSMVAGWTDATVTNDTTYFYVISAYDLVDLESEQSQEVEATPSVNITLVLQQGVAGYEGVSDTRMEWFASIPEAASMNFVDEVLLSTYDASAGGQKKSLLRFELSELASGAVVISAMLELNITQFDSSPPGNIALHRLLTEVDFADCSWTYCSNSSMLQWGNNTQSGPLTGTDYEGAPIASVTLESTGPAQWDITDAVAGWHSGSFENHGLLIADTLTFSGNLYSSSEASDPETRPKLILVYRDAGLPPGGEDSDGDGLSDETEATLGTDPNVADTDGDTLSDGDEVSLGTNPLVADTDGDGLSDGAEVAAGTDPLDTDTDDDGIIDGDDPDPLNGLDTDTDSDGLPDSVEATLGTDPNNADTDGDGLGDGVEDADHNGVIGSGETNPTVADTDGDTLSDGDEVAGGTDPLLEDTDEDGIHDGLEVFYTAESGGALVLDPLTHDSLNDLDGDGFTNLAEVEQGTSPIDPSSYPTPPYVVEALSHPFPGQGIIEGSIPVAIDDSVVIRLRDDTAIAPAQVTMTLQGTQVASVVRPVVPDDFSDCWIIYDFDGHYGYGDVVALGLQAEDTEGYVLNHTMDFRVETEAERAAADSASPPVSANGTGVLANPGSPQSGAELAFSATEPVKPTFGSVEEIPEMDPELSVAAPVVCVVPFTVFEEPITVLVPVVSGVPAEKLAELQIYYYDPSPGGGWRPVTEVDGLLVDGTRVDHIVDDEFNSLEALNALVQEENADRETVISDTAELDPELTEEDVRVILHQEVVDDSPAGTWIESDPETWTRK